MPAPCAFLASSFLVFLVQHKDTKNKDLHVHEILVLNYPPGWTGIIPDADAARPAAPGEALNEGAAIQHQGRLHGQESWRQVVVGVHRHHVHVPDNLRAQLPPEELYPAAKAWSSLSAQSTPHHLHQSTQGSNQAPPHIIRLGSTTAEAWSSFSTRSAPQHLHQSTQGSNQATPHMIRFGSTIEVLAEHVGK